jgi:hypothetical protein
MEAPANQVINWVNENLPPLSWRIITMENMKIMSRNKVFPSKIDNTTRFNDEIMAGIMGSIRQRYQKELPSHWR